MNRRIAYIQGTSVAAQVPMGGPWTVVVDQKTGVAYSAETREESFLVDDVEEFIREEEKTEWEYWPHELSI